MLKEFILGNEMSYEPQTPPPPPKKKKRLDEAFEGSRIQDSKISHSSH